MVGVGANECLLFGHFSIDGVEQRGGSKDIDVVAEEGGGAAVVCRQYFVPGAACACGLHLFGKDGGGGGLYGNSAVGAEVGGCRIGVGVIDDGGGIWECKGGDGAIEGGGESVAGKFAGTVHPDGERVGEVAFALISKDVCEGAEIGVVGQGDAVGVAAVEAVGHAQNAECGVFRSGEAGTEGTGQLRVGIVLFNEFAGVVFAGYHHQSEQHQTKKVQFSHITKFGCKGTLNSRKKNIIKKNNV